MGGKSSKPECKSNYPDLREVSDLEPEVKWDDPASIHLYAVAQITSNEMPFCRVNDDAGNTHWTNATTHVSQNAPNLNPYLPTAQVQITDTNKHIDLPNINSIARHLGINGDSDGDGWNDSSGGAADYSSLNYLVFKDKTTCRCVDGKKIKRNVHEEETTLRCTS